jgi:hypothetical protein
MGKVPFDTSNVGFPAQYVLKGEYTQIPKKNEGGIYSEELINLIYSMMNLVFFLNSIIIVVMVMIILGFKKTTNNSKNIRNSSI